MFSVWVVTLVHCESTTLEMIVRVV
jgi:hypothetical protein